MGWYTGLTHTISYFFYMQLTADKKKLTVNEFVLVFRRCLTNLSCCIFLCRFVSRQHYFELIFPKNLASVSRHEDRSTSRYWYFLWKMAENMTLVPAITTSRFCRIDVWNQTFFQLSAITAKRLGSGIPAESPFNSWNFRNSRSTAILILIDFLKILKLSRLCGPTFNSPTVCVIPPSKNGC